MRRMTPIAVTMATVALVACGSDDSSSDAPEATDAPSEAVSTEGTEAGEADAADGEDVTLWLAGTDTPEAALTYLSETYASTTGGELSIDQIGWGDLIPALTSDLRRTSAH